MLDCVLRCQLSIAHAGSRRFLAGWKTGDPNGPHALFWAQLHVVVAENLRDAMERTQVVGGRPGGPSLPHATGPDGPTFRQTGQCRAGSWIGYGDEAGVGGAVSAG